MSGLGALDDLLRSAQVRDNVAELRYELLAGADVVGLIRYRREAHAVALVHTEVDLADDGRLADALIEGALDDLRSRGLGVIPLCPCVREWMNRHDGYARLVVVDTAVPE